MANSPCEDKTSAAKLSFPFGFITATNDRQAINELPETYNCFISICAMELTLYWVLFELSSAGDIVSNSVQ